MASVSSTSRSKRRIHGSFVERNRQVLSTTGVKKVEAANKTENNISYSNANHLIASDQFYDNLERLQEHYYRFYHNEISLEKEIKALQRNNSYGAYNMKKLLEKYNKTLESLEILDKEFNTTYNIKIKNIVKNYKEQLFKIGISIGNEERLKLDTYKFIDSIKTLEKLESSLKPLKELMDVLYYKFKSIKIPDISNDSKGYTHNEIEYSGILIDEKY
ncbi:hypothetical protein [Senegalia massiliensis]|uniref:Uncharacterized protein n=1 Tax=Senegalia massiliensis TaxID=1720316 RepID=A0A845QZX3_9CLOT|nr:hypothetical protein [Senegalia massiliensis]NBI05903.1 hypothetical protein [Senegalia massiliensis]